jgi:hypothetical protein
MFLFRFRHVAFYRQPPEIVSSNGTLAVTLDVGLVDSLAGIPWSTTGVRTATGYNGASIGPTLRVKAGDVLTVTLTNSLPPTSALDLELFAFIQDPDSDETNATKIYNRLDDIGNLVRTHNQWSNDTTRRPARTVPTVPTDCLLLSLSLNCDLILLACYATIFSPFIHFIHLCRTTRSLGIGD